MSKSVRYRVISKDFRQKKHKDEVKNLTAQFWGNQISAFIGIGCSALKNWVLMGACAGLVTGAWFWINQNFEDAKANNQCAYVAISYGGDLDGWGRFNC